MHLLHKLHIQNILTFRDVSIDFYRGFHVVTGETGAGKSIFASCLSAAFGGKCSGKILGNYDSIGIITAVININNASQFKAIKTIVDGNNIDTKDGYLQLKRVIKQKSVASYINDIKVNNDDLKSIGALSFEIHSQMDNYKDMTQKSFTRFLDIFLCCENKSLEVQDLYSKYKGITKEIEGLEANREAKERELSYISYVAEELKKFDPQENEYNELLDKKKELIDKVKIDKVIKNIFNTVNGDGGISHLSSSLERDVDFLKSTSNIQEYKDIGSSVEDLMANVYSISQRLEHIYNINNGNESIDDIQERIFGYQELSKKHNVQPYELYNLLNSFYQQKDDVESYGLKMQSLQVQKKEMHNQLRLKSQELHDIRERGYSSFTDNINKTLKSLGLENLIFQIHIQVLEEFSDSGIDSISFLISNNKNNKLTDIKGTASGGEISRIMLAIKASIIESIDADVVLFDEIDVGVGSSISASMGRVMRNISKKPQVISITHAHQIAATGDYHYLINKDSIDNGVVSSMSLLNESGRIDEMSRMISDDKIDESVYQTARNILDRAKEDSNDR